MERYGSFNAGDVILVQRAPHSIDRVDPCSADGDYFRNQRIIIWRHGVAGINVRVDSNTAAAGRVIKIDTARRGLDTVSRIFRIDAALDGVQPRFCTRDMWRKRLASSDPALLLYEIARINFLGDGVLHLDARVHFHEVKVFVPIDKELDCTRVFVSN